VLYYTVELSSQASAFFFTFIEVGSYVFTAAEHGSSAFPEYDILSGLPLVGSVHVGLIFWRGWFVFFEPREFFELLGGCLLWFYICFELLIRFGLNFRRRSLGWSIILIFWRHLRFFGPVILGFPECHVELDLVVVFFVTTSSPREVSRPILLG
jgi:hypothetical protein